jgi:hypothetical protein
LSAAVHVGAFWSAGRNAVSWTSVMTSAMGYRGQSHANTAAVKQP